MLRHRLKCAGLYRTDFNWDTGLFALIDTSSGCHQVTCSREHCPARRAQHDRAAELLTGSIAASQFEFPAFYTHALRAGLPVEAGYTTGSGI